MPFIKSCPGGTGGRCHTPSGQVPETCTAGSPETPPACAGVKQSGPLVRRLHLTGSSTAGSRGPGHLPHPGLSSPLRCEFYQTPSGMHALQGESHSDRTAALPRLAGQQFRLTARTFSPINHPSRWIQSSHPRLDSKMSYAIGSATQTHVGWLFSLG